MLLSLSLGASDIFWKLERYRSMRLSSIGGETVRMRSVTTTPSRTCPPISFALLHTFLCKWSLYSTVAHAVTLAC